MAVNKPTATWRHWGAMKMIQVETAQSTPVNGKKNGANDVIQRYPIEVVASVLMT